MSLRVTPRASRREDRSGDPLDGMVNLFDLGIVLALAFLLVALASLRNEERVDTANEVKPGSVVVKPDERERPLPERGARVIGRGERIGSVYRLADGRLVYVAPKDGAGDGGAGRAGAGGAGQAGSGDEPAE